MIDISVTSKGAYKYYVISFRAYSDPHPPLSWVENCKTVLKRCPEAPYMANRPQGITY